MNFSLARIVSVEEFRDLLLRSTLSARRPVEDLDCLRGMLDNSDIVATCWNENLLVGIARSITDFSYSCYLSDLAVDVNFQKQGIGTELISLTQSMLGPHCKIILLSAPAAVDYYPHIGFELAFFSLDFAQRSKTIGLTSMAIGHHRTDQVMTYAILAFTTPGRFLRPDEAKPPRQTFSETDQAGEHTSDLEELPREQ